MPYFAVDDQITFHPKAVAAGNAAMGAWMRAGAWAKNHATGGFVSRDVAHALGVRESKRLVAVGLWEIGTHPDFAEGYWFHDWDHIAGNFDGETEKARRDAKRESDRIRQRNKRDKDASHGVTSRRLSSPSVPSPVPDPQTDDTTYLPDVRYDPAARDGIDPQLAAIIGQDESIAATAREYGIHNLSKVRTTLEGVVGPIKHHDAFILDVVLRIIQLATKPVRNADAYVKSACANSPDEVRDHWAAVVASGPKGLVA